MRRRSRSLRALVASAFLAACSSATGVDESFDADLDAARARWSAARPREYAYELSIATVWFPPQGFRRIEVRNDSVVAVRRVETGESLPREHELTIDGIYAQLARARDRGEALSALRFDAAGVPLEAMSGSFANDGGVHYAVRRFTRIR
jgi:hypothetical protein